MAKPKNKTKIKEQPKPYWSSEGRPSRSKLTRKEIYLNKHDEEKMLLFVTGIVFGVGLVAAIIQEFMFGGLALIAVGVVLLLLEAHHDL